MNATLQPIFVRQRRLSRSACIFRWLAVGLLIVALPFGVLLWLDKTLVLTTPWRWFAFALWVGGLLWMLARAPRALRAPKDRELAATLDEHSGLHGGYAISTSAELDAPRASGTAETALLARLHAVAGSLATAASPPHRLPRKWQIATLGLSLVLIGTAGPRARWRLTHPWDYLPYTTLTLAGPEELPIAREPFAVHGTVRGRTPQAVALQVSGGATVIVPVTGDGTYKYIFDKGVPAPVTLVARGAADGVSAPLAIAFRELLHPAGYEHRVTPPAYAKQPVRVETQADFSVLAHSDVGYSVTFNQEKPRARMVFDTDRLPLALVPDAHRPRVWTAELPDLTRTFGYRLEVADLDGGWVPLGEKSQVVVRPDHPPVAKITSHNEGKLKSPHDTFAMAFQASDDLGLTGVRVDYQRLGEDKPVHKVFSLPDDGTLTFAGDFKLPLDELHANPGDMIAVTVEALDNYVYPMAQTGGAEPILFEVPAEPSPGQAGGGGQGDLINPLAIEKQIYRDTLRLAYGRKGSTPAVLLQRQYDLLHHIQAMIKGEKAKNPLPKLEDLIAKATGGADDYRSLLETAAKSAVQAIGWLMEAREKGYQPALNKEGTVIVTLTKARQKEESPVISGGKVYSLLTPPAGQGKSSENSEEDAAEQALEDIRKLQQEQNRINQALGGKPPASPAQEGQGEQDDQPSGGSPGESSPQTLADREQRASERAEKIRQQVLALKAENGADPRLAAEQMALANRQQSLAAADLLHGAAGALAAGETASEALEKARQFAASLRGVTNPASTAEAQTRAPGYQQLIQEYSRRLSHD